MYLLISIDTEEDMPKWRPETVTTVKNIQVLPKIHEILKSHSVRPTYLVNRPVLYDKDAFKTIKELSLNGTCEIGMHLHSWNTPPIMSDEADGTATVLNLYPAEIQKKKITDFHNYFINRLGFAPTSYRAGRYGLSATSVRALAELGYLVDSSVVPLVDFSDYGAPNYKRYNNRPFWINTGSPESLFEIPVTVDLVTRFPRSFFDYYFAIPQWTHIKGVMHRLNLARLLWLRPTTYSYKEMRQLADFIINRDSCPVFNIMFHSSELYPGASPYNRTEGDVSDFFDRLLKIIRYLIVECGAVGVTMSEFARLAKKGDKGLSYPSMSIEL